MSGKATKMALAFGLRKALENKPLSKITIQDITNECEVNRQTFYYHFQDIQDLVEWILLEEADKALQGNKTYATSQEGFLSIFEMIQKDHVFISNVYRHTSLDILLLHLYRVVYQLIYNVVDEKSKNMIVREKDKAFIADFYKYGFVGLVLDWIKGDMKEDPKEIIQRLSVLIDGTITHSLENYHNGKTGTF